MKWEILQQQQKLNGGLSRLEEGHHSNALSCAGDGKVRGFPSRCLRKPELLVVCFASVSAFLRVGLSDRMLLFVGRK